MLFITICLPSSDSVLPKKLLFFNLFCEVNLVMGKRLVHIDGGVIFSGQLSPMINNYTDILVILHQLDVHGLD